MMTDEIVEDFLAALAKAAARIAAAEREECARLCDPGAPPCDCDHCDCGSVNDAIEMGEWRERKAIYDAIRARGDKP